MTIKRASGGVDSSAQTDKLPQHDDLVNFDAYSGHLRNVRCKMFEPVKNIWDRQLRTPKQFHEMPRILLQPKSEDWNRVGECEDAAASSSVSSIPPARLLAKSRSQISWTKKLADNRMAGIKKWVALIEKYPDSFQCGRQWKGDFQCDLGDVIMVVLSKKATGTIHDRAGPLLRYVYWCNQKGLTPFPFAEKSLYAFVNEIGQVCAPTFPRSFLCSVAFAGHVQNLLWWHWNREGLRERQPSFSRRNESWSRRHR